MSTDEQSSTAAPCAVCRGVQFSDFAFKDGWQYVSCDDCGFVVVDPMPDQTTLNELYQGDGGATATFYPKAASRARRAWLRAARLWRYLRGRRAVDVGCGGGFMVEAFRRWGADASGLDVDAEAMAYATRAFPRCRFHCVSFDRFSVAAPYDFVYSSELIEHVSRLDDYMDLMRRLTARGSHVLITTPDLGSPRVPADVRAWDVFGPPYHVQFFRRDNLRRLFDRHGFAERRVLPDRKAGLKVLFERVA